MLEPSKKRMVITGATGAIGKILCQRLRDSGLYVVVLSRKPDKAKEIVQADEYVAWSVADDGPWAKEIDGSYAVIGLAGSPFFTKWTPEYRKEAIDSRVIGTRGLVNAMQKAETKPRVFISASSVGYYGYVGFDNRKVDENFPPGDDFWGHDSVKWEAEAERASREIGVRTVILRTGIVLSRKDGPLPWWVPMFKKYWGGPIGPGRQWMPWIHIEDEVDLILFALNNQAVSGPLNATAPNPQTSKEFFATLGKVLKRPSWSPGQAFFLRHQFGQVADVVIHGKRVIPKKAQDLGYRFKFKRSEEAFRDLIEDLPNIRQESYRC